MTMQRPESQHQDMPELQDSVEEKEAHRAASSLLQIIDRALDKGVRIEGCVCVPVLGIEVLKVDFRAFAASSEKYLEYAEAMANTVVDIVELDEEELDRSEQVLVSQPQPM